LIPDFNPDLPGHSTIFLPEVGRDLFRTSDIWDEFPFIFFQRIRYSSTAGNHEKVDGNFPSHLGASAPDGRYWFPTDLNTYSLDT